LSANRNHVATGAFARPGREIALGNSWTAATFPFKTKRDGLDQSFPVCLAYSSSFRETAVTSFRGLNRTDSATSQFRNPETTRVLPAIRPR
jgi:hypothetical protein